MLQPRNGNERWNGNDDLLYLHPLPLDGACCCDRMNGRSASLIPLSLSAAVCFISAACFWTKRRSKLNQKKRKTATKKESLKISESRIEYSFCNLPSGTFCSQGRTTHSSFDPLRFLWGALFSSGNSEDKLQSLLQSSSISLKGMLQSKSTDLETKFRIDGALFACIEHLEVKLHSQKSSNGQGGTY